MRRSTSSSTFVLVVALAWFRSASGSGLVPQKQRDTALKASTKALEYCGGLEPLDITADRKADLESASGNNWILQQMKGAKDNDEFAENLEKNIDVGFVVLKGGPVVASFLFMFAYMICCWTACPCCRCCRCCKKQRKIGLMPKGVGFVIASGVILGIFISAVIARRGFQQAVAGFESTSCTGSQLLNATLSGETVPPFLGMIPTLDTFDSLIQNLDSNSGFLTSLTSVLDNTKPIEHAVTLAAGTMGLLNDMMASSANTRPKTSIGGDLLHDCTLCPQLTQVLTPAITALNDGIASQLKNARGEVQKQLTGSALTDLQSTVRDSVKPLQDLVKLMVEAFGFIVNGSNLQDLTSNIDAMGLYATLMLSFLALLIGCCACTGMGLWTFRELKPRGTEVHVGAEVAVHDLAVKYRSGVHRCAGCTWCCGCYYIFVAFLLGGVMTALSVPLASVCLILDDVNSQMLTEIGGVLPVNFTGDGGEIMKNTIDQCFRNPNKAANPLLLDIIFTRNSTGHKISLTQTIVNQTKDTINKQFDSLASKSATGSMQLNSDAQIVTLKNTLRDTRMDAMLVPSANYDFASSPYADMSLDTRTTNALSLFFASSASCTDFVVPSNMGSQSGQTLKGIAAFSNSLSNFGSQITHSSCAKTVTCTDSTSTTSGQACAAGNQFMMLKQSLQTINTFKCRKFRKNGVACDVINMVESPSGSGTYVNDCLKPDGTLEVFEYDCNLAEFTQLTQDFHTRLDLVFDRLDRAAGVVMTGISVQMKSLVQTYVIAKIERVAEGLTCGFLGKHYQKFIDGTCYAGVWGFTQISTSYVASGVLTLILVMMMYIVWRISVDNFNHGQTVIPFDNDTK
jgi:hypothetical protein